MLMRSHEWTEIMGEPKWEPFRDSCTSERRVEQDRGIWGESLSGREGEKLGLDFSSSHEVWFHFLQKGKEERMETFPLSLQQLFLNLATKLNQIICLLLKFIFYLHVIWTGSTQLLLKNQKVQKDIKVKASLISQSSIYALTAFYPLMKIFLWYQSSVYPSRYLCIFKQIYFSFFFLMLSCNTDCSELCFLS